MSGELIRQWAIRNPDGELWEQPGDSLFGIGASNGPKVFDSLEAAQKTLLRLQEEARSRYGLEWLGVIEQRLCTPFTVSDPAAQLVTEIQHWMDGAA